MSYLSVITVNFNNAGGVEKTILSVATQIFKSFEHIIIDGNSTDSSLELVKNYQDSFMNQLPIIHYISEPDAGVYDAMNKGIQKATGEYLLFLNSGDFFYNEYALQNFANASPRADIVSGDVLIKAHSLQDGGQLKQPPDTLTAGYLFNSYLPHPATFIKKELFNRVGLYTVTRRIVADWEFFLKAILLHQATYLHLPVTVSTFISDGMSSDPANANLIEQEKEEILATYFPYFVRDYTDFAACVSNQKAFQDSPDRKILGFLRKIYIPQFYKFVSRIFLKSYLLNKKWLK